MKIPVATYRIQLNYKFGFEKTENIINYLKELGISDIYASPILKAKKGSTHGYDSVSYTEINPEFGTYEQFENLAKKVKNNGLGWLQDIVPNHMACNSQNLMLMDVLESGKNSVYYNFFDIEWNHAYESIKGKLLIPFLGDYYSNILERGEIKLNYNQNGFSVSYYDSYFPISIDSYNELLTYKFSRLEKKLGSQNPDFIKFLGLLYVLKTVYLKKANDDEKLEFEQTRFIKNILWELYNSNEEIKKFIDKNIHTFNGESGNPQSFDLLNKLLGDQNFRLSYWKVANEEINYRRFFCINDLISLKIEEKEVFDHIHAFIFELMKKEYITSLRIDHIDGLNNPNGYLKTLREAQKETYILVEKILEFNEDLPEEWDIQGTTGYEFMNRVNGVFCKLDNEKKFTKIYKEFSKSKTDYDELIYENKMVMIDKYMTGDIDNLSHLLKRISSKYRHGSDVTLHGIKSALVEILCLFSVYRTYVTPQNFVGYNDRYILEAVKRAIERSPELTHELNFIKHFLTYVENDHLTDDEKNDRIKFVMRFQQFTGPLMAKGFEDTVLYIYNRLISLNEVGGTPQKFGISSDDFHDFNQKRFNEWRYIMNSTSTHDTKRGEDIRARINVLSEIPEEWEQKIKSWHQNYILDRSDFKNLKFPDPNDEYLIYQMIIGAYPFYQSEYDEFISRIKEYIIKALREAKVFTGWITQNDQYETACLSFIDFILNHDEFKKDLYKFQKRIAYFGIFNSLSQTLLKMTSPGVTDFYQGCELWNLSMVDPDNRREVDFEKRKVYLEEIKNKETNKEKLISELLDNKEDGQIKLFLVYQTLKAKNQYRELFQDGEYIRLSVEGKFKDKVISFARKYADKVSITIIPRFLTDLMDDTKDVFAKDIWEDTIIHLPKDFPNQWTDCFSDKKLKGKSLKINDVFANFPVALLIG